MASTINTGNKSSKSAKSVSSCMVGESSKNGHAEKVSFLDKASAMSQSDKLTLRAWKYTYANRRKSED